MLIGHYRPELTGAQVLLRPYSNAGCAGSAVHPRKG